MPYPAHPYTHPKHIGGDGIDMRVEGTSGGPKLPQGLNVVLYGRYTIGEVLRETGVHLLKP